MILRKPYAFFIRYFKIIHVLISVSIGYLIYQTNLLLSFFSKYLNSTVSVVGQELLSNLFSPVLFIIPIVVVALSLVILAVMFRKNKPYRFYIINTFLFIVIFVLFVYSKSVLESMESVILNIKVVKLTHDLLVLTMMAESITFLFFFTRGIGLNFKKFDFSSDLNKLSISDSDKEEIEVNISFDVNEKRRNLRRNLRNLKYKYIENKFKINLGILSFIMLIGVGIYYFIYVTNNNIKEGTLISSNGIDFIVNESYLVNLDKKNLVVVDIDIASWQEDKTLYLKDLILDIENYKITNTLKYCSKLTDAGVCYRQNKLNTELKNYIVVYEIPDIYLNSKMILNYVSINDNKLIDLTVQKDIKNKLEYEYKLGDKLEFKEKMLKNVNFKISSIDIQNKYKINYNYCTKNNNCFESYEYLKPTLDTNFDKNILKLNIEYNSQNSDYSTFYDLLAQYGYIEYYINNQIYKQDNLFEDIKSLKVSNKNINYIGIKNEIALAEKINIVFEFRNNRYVYKIRGE